MLNLTHTYMNEQVKKNKNKATDYKIALCRVIKADFIINFIERVILIIMLGIILYMTVRYTDRAKSSKKNRLFSRKTQAIKAENNSNGDSTQLISPSEQKQNQMAMAERLAQHNARLADEVMAIIIAQMRQESETAEEENSC